MRIPTLIRVLETAQRARDFHCSGYMYMQFKLINYSGTTQVSLPHFNNHCSEKGLELFCCVNM